MNNISAFMFLDSKAFGLFLTETEKLNSIERAKKNIKRNCVFCRKRFRVITKTIIDSKSISNDGNIRQRHDIRRYLEKGNICDICSAEY